VGRGLIIVLPLFLGVGGACGMAEPGHPSEAAASRITVSGMLTDEGVECQALQGDDGQLYTLLGDLHALRAGERVCVSGERLDLSICQQGITIRVRSIAPADRCEES
jgi:hypothetical protein